MHEIQSRVHCKFQQLWFHINHEIAVLESILPFSGLVTLKKRFWKVKKEMRTNLWEKNEEKLPVCRQGAKCTSAVVTERNADSIMFRYSVILFELNSNVIKFHCLLDLTTLINRSWDVWDVAKITHNIVFDSRRPQNNFVLPFQFWSFLLSMLLSPYSRGVSFTTYQKYWNQRLVTS